MVATPYHVAADVVQVLTCVADIVQSNVLAVTDPLASHVSVRVDPPPPPVYCGILRVSVDCVQVAAPDDPVVVSVMGETDSVTVVPDADHTTNPDAAAPGSATP